MSLHVAIVGNGLAGPLLACYLAKLGMRVTLLERRADPRAHGYAGGRSINLALSARGYHALAGVGLDSVVRDHDALPMPGRIIHPLAAPRTPAPTVFQPYSTVPGEAIHSVSRGGLNRRLIAEAARMPGVELAFDTACIDVEIESPGRPSARPVVHIDSPHGARRMEADLIIGADGAFSAVRARLQKTDRFEYSQTYLSHGYKELHIPPAHECGVDPARYGGWALDPAGLHIWPRGGAMMIALPNRDHTFTCTLFWPFEGEHGLARERTDGEVRAFFETHYPDAVPLMPTLVPDFRVNPSSSLVTIRCWPWQHHGRVLVLGDAAHAIVPFYGQGMNAAFEDCRELAARLGAAGLGGIAPESAGSSAALGGTALSPQTRVRLERAIEEFQHTRKPNADAIAEMAIANFLEMRDKTGRPEFLYRKRVEQALHAAFPDRVHPQYNLVSFSTVPYTEAQRRGRALDGVLDEVVARVPAHERDSLSESAWLERVLAAGRSALDARPADSGASIAAPITAASITAAPIAARETLDESARTPPGAPADLIDITPAVSPALGVWPGDTSFSREVLLDRERGDSITLSTIRTTVHLGAHADGPNHYGTAREGATGIDAVPLTHYVGPCRVLRARVLPGARIRPNDVEGLEQLGEPRLLLATGTFADPEKWNSDFAALSVELVDWLGARGVITIGIDTPSVDPQDSKDLPAHRAILRHRMAILEGLALRDVEPGVYELIAPPLKLVHADASPVRALLRRLNR